MQRAEAGSPLLQTIRGFAAATAENHVAVWVVDLEGDEGCIVVPIGIQRDRLYFCPPRYCHLPRPEPCPVGGELSTLLSVPPRLNISKARRENRVWPWQSVAVRCESQTPSNGSLGCW